MYVEIINISIFLVSKKTYDNQKKVKNQIQKFVYFIVIFGITNDPPFF